MMAAEKEIVYARTPVATWRWLGINELLVPEQVLSGGPLQRILTIPPGETRRITFVCRDNDAVELRAEVGAGAALYLTRVRLSGENSRYADAVSVTLDEGARLIYTAVETGGAPAVSTLDTDLSGDGSSADISMLYFADGRQKLDMNCVVHQRGRRTRAELSVSGALSERAQKSFRGTLDFARGATGSVGRESETVTLLSPNAVNRSAPLMLSGEADVDGRHAASIGRIDAEKLFYLTSRGLSPSEAKRLIVLAAAAPVLDRIDDAALADEVRAYIERRISDD